MPDADSYIYQSSTAAKLCMYCMYVSCIICTEAIAQVVKQQTALPGMHTHLNRMQLSCDSLFSVQKR